MYFSLILSKIISITYHKYTVRIVMIQNYKFYMLNLNSRYVDICVFRQHTQTIQKANPKAKVTMTTPACTAPAPPGMSVVPEQLLDAKERNSRKKTKCIHTMVCVCVECGWQW